MNKLFMLVLLASLSSSALAFKMPSAPGGDSDAKEESNSGMSAADAQEAIVVDFKAALGHVFTAQGHVMAALGLKDGASQSTANADRLNGNDCKASCLEESAEASAAAQQKIEEEMAKGSELDAKGKKELAKAYIPLGKGTMRMAKLAPKAKDWAKGAMDEIKGAGVMGAGKMKKKLATGLYIAKTTPTLIGNWSKTTSDLISFGKKAGVSTKGASGDEMAG